jgi:hypothetical protein
LSVLRNDACQQALQRRKRSNRLRIDHTDTNRVPPQG